MASGHTKEQTIQCSGRGRGGGGRELQGEILRLIVSPHSPANFIPMSTCTCTHVYHQCLIHVCSVYHQCQLYMDVTHVPPMQCLIQVNVFAFYRYL